MKEHTIIKRLENAKSIFTEYDFLRLLVINLQKMNEAIIIKHDLEMELLEFYDHPNFHFLFQDLCPKRDIIVNDGNYVDLSAAFQKAFAFGLLVQLHDSFPKLRCIIPYYTDCEIEEISSRYDIMYTQAMEIMVSQLLEKRRTQNCSPYIKKI